MSPAPFWSQLNRKACPLDNLEVGNLLGEVAQVCGTPVLDGLLGVEHVLAKVHRAIRAELGIQSAEFIADGLSLEGPHEIPRQQLAVA